MCLVTNLNGNTLKPKNVFRINIHGNRGKSCNGTSRNINVKRKKKHDGICLFTTNGISQNHSNGKFIAMNVFCIKNINGFSSAFPLMYFNMLFYHFPLKKTRMIF